MNSRIRSWAQRRFYDPATVLPKLRQLELSLADTEISEKVRRLRTNQLKTYREARDALLFAHGMATALGAKVLVGPGETEDCDFITKVRLVDAEYFSCVQLKEWVPAEVNASQQLDGIFAKLRSTAKSDSVLAIRLNRRVSVPLSALIRPLDDPFAEVWYFWAADESAVVWQLYGNAKGAPSLYEFKYPN